MDKLIANASVGLAKAGMDRRGFLGRVAGAVGGAAALSVLLTRAAYADHCDGHHFCITSQTVFCGGCGENCSPSKRPWVRRVEGKNCYTGETCPPKIYYSGCGCIIPGKPCPGEK